MGQMNRSESGESTESTETKAAKKRTREPREGNWGMSTAGSNILARRIAVLALSVASFAAAERANAACTPTTSAANPVTNATVDCTGATLDQNTDGTSNFGYGTGNETGITVNVQSGASVTGTSVSPASSGIFVGDGTVNNSGTVTVSSLRGLGVFGLNNITVINSGKINFDTTGQ